jgi:hypothetical protein
MTNAAELQRLEAFFDIRVPGASSSAANRTTLSTTHAILSPFDASVPAGSGLRPKEAAAKSTLVCQ